MRKAEFLSELEECLLEELSQAAVRDNLIYYDRYITSEVTSGRTEDEVLEELGSPRLIAKTIIEAAEAGGEAGGSYGGGYGNSYSYSESGSYDNGYSDDYGRDDRDIQTPWGNIHYFDLSKWYVKLGLVLAIVAILSIVMFVVGGIFTLLAPVAGPIILAYVVYAMLRRR